MASNTGKWAGNIACKGKLIDINKNLLLKYLCENFLARKFRELVDTITLRFIGILSEQQVCI
jgi:hypothetical protein